MAILTPEQEIGLDAIPVEIRRFREAGPVEVCVQEARESAERDHILSALDAADWNVSSAARALGLERTNLHKRCARSVSLGKGKPYRLWIARRIAERQSWFASSVPTEDANAVRQTESSERPNDNPFPEQ